MNSRICIVYGAFSLVMCVHFVLLPNSALALSDVDEKLFVNTEVLGVPLSTSTRAVTLQPAEMRLYGSQDVWLYDYSISLFNDFDDDGHYTSIRLSLDLDTLALEREVFVDISLVDPEGFSTLLHTSQSFYIYSDSFADTFEVVSELKQGFHARHYDIVVEVFDAANLSLLAQYDYRDIPGFSLLALESEDVDVTYQSSVVYETHTEAGSIGELSGLLFLLILAFRNKAQLIGA